ncbi:hypothetical protein GGI07_004489 [Coemansia sp. Benny D115]|nr:hypothetical protein GGI07_004489 [Coemansia sp. Benny D115]
MDKVSSKSKSKSKSKKSEKSEKTAKIDKIEKSKSDRTKSEKMDKKKDKKRDKESKSSRKSKDSKKESKRKTKQESEDSSSEPDISSDDEEKPGVMETAQNEATRRVRDLETGLERFVATNLDLVQAGQSESVDPQIQARFKEVYMEYVTMGFGSDLDALRKEEEIGDEGLEILIDALETGTRSFTAADQKMIVDEI